MRVATAMDALHYVLHAPQGDTYADLLFTMIERQSKRPPVTYTTFQARDLGGDTAELFKTAAREAYERFKPQALLVGASCTAELIQDDPGGLARALELPVPVVAVELPAYQRKENWGASETFYPIGPSFRQTRERLKKDRLLQHTGTDRAGLSAPRRHSGDHPPAGPSWHRHKRHRTPQCHSRPLTRLGDAHFNVVLYPEIGLQAASWLSRNFGQPMTKAVPIGVGAVRDFIAEVAALAQVDPSPVLDRDESRLPWYSRSVDSTYLTGKRVFIFGDATHVVAAARVASEELGFKVVGVGTYAREFAREVRDAGERHGVEALITDDYLTVEARIAELQPELVLGTQMERHISKRLGVPCAVISAPVHVQDFPARYSPQMGFEGANVIFDTWVHPLMMGLEEHLLGMFRDDPEFHDDAGASHLGERKTSRDLVAERSLIWDSGAEMELKKIPFFVRGKARRNTERFALDRGLTDITLETLYDAKAHFGR
jgi:light-independent protochlorophyllide reductase subunit B